jgi:uncharacterized coiled-coil protein SlyX
MLKFLLNFIPGIGPALSAAWSFIAAHWHFFAVAAIVGMLAYQNFSNTRFLFGIPTIPHLEQQVAADKVEIDTLTKDLDIAAKANATLAKSITDQNTTIGQWKDVSDKLQKQNDALVGTLAQMQHDTSTQVTAILKGKTPETCEASIQYLRDMRQKLTW